MTDTTSAALCPGRILAGRDRGEGQPAQAPSHEGSAMRGLLWALPPSLAFWAAMGWSLWRLVG